MGRTATTLGLLVHALEAGGNDTFVTEEFAAIDKLVVIAGILVVDLADILLQGLAVLVHFGNLFIKAQLDENLCAVMWNKKGGKESRNKKQRSRSVLQAWFE